MMNDIIEKHIEDISSASYKLGIVSGLEAGARVLMDIAKQHFSYGDDVNAKRIRELAQVLKKDGEDARREYEESFKEIKNIAWLELESILEGGNSE